MKFKESFYKNWMKYPDLSSILIFKMTAEYSKLAKESLRSNFNKLVDKNDYEKSEKEIIFRWATPSRFWQ